MSGGHADALRGSAGADMGPQEQARRLTQIALVAMLGLVLVEVAGVLLRPALPVDETRYLAVAWEMHLNHNWLVPTKNFELYSDKPPLLFWLINLSWAIFGVSDLAARIVAPLIAFVVALLTGKLAARLWPEDAGIQTRAILSLIAMPFFLFDGGLTMFDTLLTACVLAGLIALTHAGEGRRAGWLWFGGAVALGVLAKGPVILFHLMPAALTLPLWHRDRPGWAPTLKGVGLGLLAGLALVALWLVPAILTGGEEYRNAILWKQSAGRMSESFAHARPVWWYLPLLPLLFFPWILVPQVWKRLRQFTTDPVLRLMAIWVLTTLLLFSLVSGKQPHYLTPELPAIALLAARLLREGKVSLYIAAVVPGLLALVMLVGGAGLLNARQAETLLLPRGVPIAGALAIIALLWFVLPRMRLGSAALLSLGLTLVLNLALGLSHARDLYDARAVTDLVGRYEDAGIAFAGQSYHAEFNFAGRMTHPVALLDEVTLDDWATTHPEGVLIARTDRFDPGWVARWTTTYRNRNYAVWRMVDRPATETKP